MVFFYPALNILTIYSLLDALKKISSSESEKTHYFNNNNAVNHGLEGYFAITCVDEHCKQQ